MPPAVGSGGSAAARLPARVCRPAWHPLAPGLHTSCTAPAPVLQPANRLHADACPAPHFPLQAAAPQAGPSLLEQLFSWRQALLDELGQRKDMAAQRKQVRVAANHPGIFHGAGCEPCGPVAAMQSAAASCFPLLVARAVIHHTLLSRSNPQLTIEALFLEAAARLVGAAPAHLSQQKGRDLEDLAFDWLLSGDANLAFLDPGKHKNWVSGEACWGRGHRAVADHQVLSCGAGKRHPGMRKHEGEPPGSQVKWRRLPGRFSAAAVPCMSAPPVAGGGGRVWPAGRTVPAAPVLHHAALDGGAQQAHPRGCGRFWW